MSTIFKNLLGVLIFFFAIQAQGQQTKDSILTPNISELVGTWHHRGSGSGGGMSSYWKAYSPDKIQIDSSSDSTCLIHMLDFSGNELGISFFYRLDGERLIYMARMGQKAIPSISVGQVDNPKDFMLSLRKDDRFYLRLAHPYDSNYKSYYLNFYLEK